MQDVKKRAEFEANFASLINPYVDSYKGREPIISWDNDKVYPIIERDFFNHLPTDVQDRLKYLINTLMD